MPDTLVFHPEYSSFRYFLFLFKNNRHPFFLYKIQPCPILVLDKLAKAPFLCSSQCCLQRSTPFSWKTQLGIGPGSLVQEVCPLSSSIISYKVIVDRL